MDRPANIAQAVGFQIREQRGMRNINLSQMAQAMGYSDSGWSRLETGRTVMTVIQLVKACRFLECSPWRVFQLAEMALDLAGKPGT